MFDATTALDLLVRGFATGDVCSPFPVLHFRPYLQRLMSLLLTKRGIVQSFGTESFCSALTVLLITDRRPQSTGKYRCSVDRCVIFCSTSHTLADQLLQDALLRSLCPRAASALFPACLYWPGSATEGATLMKVFTRFERSTCALTLGTPPSSQVRSSLLHCEGLLHKRPSR
jgi:hypothetical protein